MIPPGHAYTTQITATNITNVVCTCGGTGVYPRITDDGHGQYTLKFSSSDIFCPGPLLIVEGTTQLERQEVGPCN